MNPHPPAPTKASEAIRLALADLEKCEENPAYKIAMGSWHEPTTESGGYDTCHVCLAGAVMAQRLGVDMKTNTYPDDMPADWKGTLYSLNFARRGIGKEELGTPEHPGFSILGSILPITPPLYDFNPQGFKRDMLKLADLYEAEENRREAAAGLYTPQPEQEQQEEAGEPLAEYEAPEEDGETSSTSEDSDEDGTAAAPYLLDLYRDSIRTGSTLEEAAAIAVAAGSRQ